MNADTDKTLTPVERKALSVSPHAIMYTPDEKIPALYTELTKIDGKIYIDKHPVIKWSQIPSPLLYKSLIKLELGYLDLNLSHKSDIVFF